MKCERVELSTFLSVASFSLYFCSKLLRFEALTCGNSTVRTREALILEELFCACCSDMLSCKMSSLPARLIPELNVFNVHLTLIATVF